MLLVTTLWVGALWCTGLSAYLIFDTIQDRQLAGAIAGKLFTAVSYIGVVSGIFLLGYRFVVSGKDAFKQSVFWITFVMLLLVLLGHFGIQAILAQLKVDAYPNNVMDSIYARQFGKWHGIAGLVYLIECLLGFVLLLKLPIKHVQD